MRRAERDLDCFLCAVGYVINNIFLERGVEGRWCLFWRGGAEYGVFNKSRGAVWMCA